MGSINGLLTSLFPGSFGQSNSTANNTSGVSSAQLPAYGAAFQISLNQQENADGTDTDVATYTSYSTCGNTATMSMSEGTGNNADNAFEALLASMQSSGNGGSCNASAGTTDPLGKAFDSLVGSLGNNSGSVSLSEGELLVPVRDMDGSGGRSEAFGGSDAMSQFVESILNSLETNLGGNAGIVTADASQQNSSAAAKLALT